MLESREDKLLFVRRSITFKGEYEIQALGQRDSTGMEYCAWASFIQALHVLTKMNNPLGASWAAQIYYSNPILATIVDKNEHLLFPNVNDFIKVVNENPNLVLQKLIEFKKDLIKDIEAIRNDAIGFEGEFFNKDNWIISSEWFRENLNGKTIFSKKDVVPKLKDRLESSIIIANLQGYRTGGKSIYDQETDTYIVDNH